MVSMLLLGERSKKEIIGSYIAASAAASQRTFLLLRWCDAMRHIGDVKYIRVYMIYNISPDSIRLSLFCSARSLSTPSHTHLTTMSLVSDSSIGE